MCWRENYRTACAAFVVSQLFTYVKNAGIGVLLSFTIVSRFTMATVFLSAPLAKTQQVSGFHSAFHTILANSVAAKYAIYAHLIAQICSGDKAVVFDRDRRLRAEGVVVGCTPSGNKAGNSVRWYDIHIRNLLQVPYSVPPAVNACGIAVIPWADSEGSLHSEIPRCPVCNSLLRRINLARHLHRAHGRISSANIPSSMPWMRDNELRGTGMDTPASRTRRKSPQK
jgi:hypothetical protein